MPAPYEVDDYTDLVISQHQKPNFITMLSALLRVPVDLQDQLASMLTMLDVDIAVGDQLDIVGAWVNRSRYITAPVADIFFSLDDPALGLDQGVWFGPYTPLTGITALDDDHYRLLLRAKIASNSWDGGLASSITILSDLLRLPILDPSKVFLFTQDNEPGRTYIGLSGELPGQLALALLTGGYLALRGQGNSLHYAVTSVSGTAVFGLDADNQYIGGLDRGSWATITPPF